MNLDFGLFEKKKMKIFVSYGSLSDRAICRVITRERKMKVLHSTSKIIRTRCNYFLWVYTLGHIDFINNFQYRKNKKGYHIRGNQVP